MDAGTIRATCPKCQSPLRIPAAWAGKVVKCKKCGSGVRVGELPSAPVPEQLPPEPAAPYGYGDAGNAFSGMGPSQPRQSLDNPFEGGGAEQSPGYYPYGQAPGYAAPGYGAPPGYAPPGYAAPGYAPPGYAAPGYAPPGYAAPGYAPPPGYGYPAPPQASPMPAPRTGPSAAAVAVGGDFKPSEALASHSSRRGAYRRRKDHGKFIWIGVALLATVGLVFVAIYMAKLAKRSETETVEGTKGKDKPGSTPASKGGSTGLLANSGALPRRLLFIHVSNYLYLNPLTHAQVVGGIQGPDVTRPAAIRLSYDWRIPRDKDNDQLFVLSDTAPGDERRLPMKDVIKGTYEGFFNTSRAQDRILVYFGGHVFTKGGKTYIVPMEGDPDEPENMIPLSEFYSKMQACKATQKVVIWDVCRYNPERGRQRPGSEPMSAETAKALEAVPPGVQAVLTDQPGENALEFYNAQPDGINKPSVIGSNFLSAVRYAVDKNRNNAKQQLPNDPIPIAEWLPIISQRVSEVAAADGKSKQTVKIYGTARATLVAANKDEAPASRFEFPPSPKSASPAEVGAIASEINLPGIKRDDGESTIASFPFPAEALAPYKADVPVTEIRANKAKYPFRMAVLDAFEIIRDVWTGGGETKAIREEFVGKSTDAVKKEVLSEQRFPARGIAKLDGAIVVLESVAAMRDAQPKRWQANYDYAMAQCKARLAWMNEYDLALGSIRTEVLPPLDPKKGQDGYRLVSTEKMKVRAEAKFAEEAKELYEQIIKDYKGSPWAIQAKRDKSFSLGLKWQPFSSKSADPMVN